MTSGKMRRCELKAREEWKKGREIRGVPGPTGDQIDCFKMGFNMAWKIILTRKKLYRTFNIHWEKLPEEECLNGQKSYVLVNNDGDVLAHVYCYPAHGLKFKYHLIGKCKEIDLRYSELIDTNDIDILKRRLKQEILEKYIACKICPKCGKEICQTGDKK